MMETTKSTGGRPRHTFVDPHVIPITDEKGNASKCTYCGHRFGHKTTVTRIKAHLGRVPGQGVAPCEKVPPSVEEAAKNAMPNSSTSSRRSRVVQAGASTPNIPHHLGHTHTQQPRSHQNLEFCHLDSQQPDLQAWLQECGGWLLSSPRDGESHLGHDMTRDGLSQSAQYMAEDHEGLQPPPNTLNPISTGAQQTHECQNSKSLSLAPLEPQYMLTELRHEFREMPSFTPQTNEGLWASQYPRQQHLREHHDHLPDQELLQDAAGMDSAHDAITPRNLLQRGACPNSLPDSGHQEDISISEFDGHGGSEPQNMQLDVSVQRSNSLQLGPSGTGTDVLCRESPIEMSNLFRDFDPFRPLILNDPQLNKNEMALNTPQPNESCATDGVLVSPHSPQQHPREPYQDVLQDAPRMDSVHDTSIPQDILQRGGASPDSLPHSAHQGNIPVAGFDYHEGSGSQHCMQENLQEDQRIDHDLIPPILPQPQHTHIASQLESSCTPTCASDQTNERKRKLSPPIGKKLPPLASKFQSPTFHERVDEIVKSLEDDSVSRIGVYGMGGSGKTTIMAHIHNRLLEENIIPLTHVIWITVSQDRTIPTLQQHLASWLDFKLPTNGGQVEWAATLYEKMQNMHYALILDDMWSDIDLDKVGIPKPSQENKSKLILTTRLRDVCHKMNCDRAIFLDLLSEEEAGDLFEKMWDRGDIPKTLTIQSIMKEIVKECARLPLAIVVVARGMRGKSRDYEWRSALESLRNRTYETIDEEKRVIRILEFSFENLSEHLRQCLLYCALYPNDFLWEYGNQELIRMLIMEGIIGSNESLKSAYDHVQTILKKLENACLLTRGASSRFQMHDLIRDMCLHIMRGRFLVKFHLKSPPDLCEYKEDVEKISLFGLEFKEIPMMKPYCPKLSTLLLMESWPLTRIADSFFMGFPGLKVLNLSYTRIQELPSSVTNLVSLNALVLRLCPKLRHLPCLAPLKALKQLDLYKSGIQKAPKGLEELVNLVYLNLDGTDIELVSSSIANLVKLQYLLLPYSTELMMEDVKELKNLEVLKAAFEIWEEVSEYVNGERGTSKYKINVLLDYGGYFSGSIECEITRDFDEGGVSATLSFDEDNMCEVFPGQKKGILSSEVIGKIPSPEIVREISINGDGCPPDNYPDFSTCLISVSSVAESSSFPGVLSCFQNLEEIYIGFYNSIETIVDTENHIEKEGSNNPVIFPNLRKLVLQWLQNLRSICDGCTLMCPSIEYIWIRKCPELKRLALQLPPMLDNNSGQLSPPLSSLKEIRGDSEWWESLEWDQPHAKALLQPYLKPLGPMLEWLNNERSDWSHL